jgi:hypothetical protein
MRAVTPANLSDGRQIFLTEPFDPGTADGLSFLAVYLFDRSGRLLDAQIEQIPSDVSREGYQQRIDARLAALGRVSYGLISVQPFTVRRFGEDFGLIAAFDEEADMWWVTAEPGNYMAFAAPWDSGEYDT